jgi:hypothetical protein
VAHAVNVNVGGGKRKKRRRAADFAAWHIVHGCLTLFTCGAWGFVWLAHWLLWRAAQVNPSSFV